MKIAQRRHWLLSLFLLFFVAAQAQQPYFFKITTQNGLPSETIFDLYSDASTGFIYLGTDNGLFRYNGSEFKKIPINTYNSLSISDIISDTRGNIWCRNFSNQLFYMESDTLKLFDTKPFFPKENMIIGIGIEGNNLWIGTTHEIVSLNIFNNKIIHKFKVNEGTFFETLVAHHNKICWTTESQTVAYLYQDNIIKKIELPEKPLRFYIDTEIYAIGQMQSTGNIYKLNRNTYETINVNQLSPNTFINTVKKTQDNYWICSNDGAWLLDEKNDAQQFFAKDRISDIITDYQGHIWISSLDNGLYCIPSLDIHTLLATEKYNVVTSSNNRLLAANTQGTVIEIEGNQGKVKAQYTSAVKTKINFVYFDTLYKKIYTSTSIFDVKTKKISKDIGFVRDIAIDDNNNYIGAVHRSVYIANLNVNKKTILYDGWSKNCTQYDEKIEIIQGRVRAVHYDRKHRKIWCAFSEKLSSFNLKGEEHIIQDKGSNIYANDIVNDSNGNTWVATVNSGIFIFNQEKKIKNIHNAHIKNIKKMVCSGSKMYFCDDNNIFIADINTFEVAVFKKFNNIGIDYIYSLTIHDNKIWICSSKGIIYTDTEDIKVTKNYLPKLHINEIKLGEIKIKANEINIVPFQSNSFNLHYEPVYFVTKNFDYTYRLYSKDSGWMKLSNENKSISLASLNYGDYIFELHLIDNILNVKSEKVSYKFTIERPFWFTWWFISLEIIIVLFLLIISFAFYLKKIKKKQEIKEKIISSQLTALRSQMNPHFIYNILNSIQGLVYGERKDEAVENIGKFSDMMRKILEMSDKQYVSLEQEIEALRLYVEMEQLRNKEIVFELSVEKTIDVKNIHVPTMLIQPIIENAIKHGLYHKIGQKNLHLSFKEEINSTDLLVEIDDNGIGRKESERINFNRRKHKSFASKAIDSRISLLNMMLDKPIRIKVEDKFDENEKPLGTKVLIYIPIQK